MKLYDYQEDIIEQLHEEDNWALFVERGRGKSIMAISIIEKQKFKYNGVLVVCRKNKIKEWEEDVSVISGIPVEIINYESIEKIDPETHKGWFILLDESQNIKTPSSKRYKHLKKFKTRKCMFGLLSGTPQHSLYIDYYTSLFLLGLYDKSLTKFKQEYCVLFQPPGQLYVDIVDYKNVDGLLHMLDDKRIAWYHSKSAHPPVFYDVEFKRPEIHKKILKDQVFKDALFDTPGKTALYTRIMETGVFQEEVLTEIKMNWILSSIPFDKRVIIFTNFIDELNYIAESLDKCNIRYNIYCGERKDVINERVAIVNCNAGGSGVNAFADFDIAIFNSIPVKYIEMEQAIGRIDRIGQTKSPEIYFLMFPDEKRRFKEHIKRLQFDDELFG